MRVLKAKQQKKVFCNWEVDDGWFVSSGKWLMENQLVSKNKCKSSMYPEQCRGTGS